MADTHLLGKYRKFGLFYDEDEDVFYSDLHDRYDMKKEPKRASLKSIKELIDKTIKDNSNFVPFKAYRAYVGYDAKYRKGKRIAEGTPTEITITGIKKNGGLFYTEERNEKVNQLNGDDRLQLFVKDKESEKLGAEIAIIEADISSLQNKKNEILEKYVPMDLSFIDDFIK